MSNKIPQEDNDRNGIGTLNEFSLHAEIINWLSLPGDNLEAHLEGYRIDIQRPDQLIEVQTRGLAKLIKKVNTLAESYPITIVYPIYKVKYIRRIDKEDQTVSRRKSPKNGKLVHVFDELVYTPDLIQKPNASLLLMLIEGEEVWKDDGQGSWRRKHWSIADRHLIKVISQRTFHQPHDLLELLPRSLPAPFTNKDLAISLNIPARLAGKITYTFRKMDLITVIGKQGRSNLFNIQ